jgi:hypothetical protein
MGTAAYHIEDPRQQAAIYGALQVPGTPIESTSHRSKLGGLYGIVTVVEALVKHHKITSGSIEVGCDGQSALRAFDLEYYFDPRQADFDFLSSIQSVVRDSPIKWKPRHILGHQDLHNPMSIDHWASLNIKMDQMAKDFWKEVNSDPERHMDRYQGTLFREGWKIWNGRHKLTNLDKHYLHEAIHGPRVKDWWIRHGRIQPEAMLQIDWALVGPAMRRMTFPRRKWLTKHVSANCGVGETLVQWGVLIDADCPRCGESESTEHVIRCPSPSAKEQWKKSLTKLEKWMKKLTALPQLRSAILVNLERWRENEPIFYPEGHRWPHVRSAIDDQARIGWGLMLEGCLSRHWKEVQEEYYSWLDRRNTGRRWTELLIVKLVEVAWDMWDHRNHSQHAPDNPRRQKALTALDQAVLEELQRGRGILPEPLWHHLDTSEEDLQARQEGYKKSWLRTIEAGRRYAIARTEGQDPIDIGYEPEREALRKWILTGRY